MCWWSCWPLIHPVGLLLDGDDVFQVELELHHHLAPLDRDVQEHVTVARWERCRDPIFRAHDFDPTARTVEGVDSAAEVDEAVEDRTRSNDVHDLPIVATVVCIGLGGMGVYVWGG